MEDLELLSFNIISAVGTAKSRYVQAMYLAEKGDFDEARAKIKEQSMSNGDESFSQAHEAHLQLLQQEMNTQEPQITMLMAHAEDQLMNAETTKIMAEEIIKLSQRIKKLEGGE